MPFGSIGKWRCKCIKEYGKEINLEISLNIYATHSSHFALWCSFLENKNALALYAYDFPFIIVHRIAHEEQNNHRAAQFPAIFHTLPDSH